MLFIFSGLPGVGKSTVAREIAKRLKAVYVRADTIEQAMRDCMPDYEVTIEGYEIAYAVAAENLGLGLRVVADSVNPLNITRDAWRNTAISQGKEFMDIEVICSDATEHRRRVEQRVSDIPGLKLPTWDETVSRQYEPWTMKRLIIDTAMSDIHLLSDKIESIALMLEKGMRIEVAKVLESSMQKYDSLYRQLGE